MEEYNYNIRNTLDIKLNNIDVARI